MANVPIELLQEAIDFLEEMIETCETEVDHFNSLGQGEIADQWEEKAEPIHELVLKLKLLPS